MKKASIKKKDRTVRNKQRRKKIEKQRKETKGNSRKRQYKSTTNATK